MNIRECAWCGKAIYGHDYYWRLGSGKFYHRGCPADDGKGEASVVMGNNQESKCGGGGGSGEIIISIDGKLSVCDSEMLKKENARLKELNREMVEAINQLVDHIKQEHNLNNNDEIYCPHIKRLAGIAEKAEEGKGE